ncbi:hypothetical protein Sjap_023823 [Stephania japonica]|uniref:SART-1 family protein DOT2 n=1 Tax=Stephania japonica TaxID=461633 RepID=A0AAP0HNC3_9MAGN
MAKDHKKTRREEKDHGSRDRERSKTSDSSKDREKEDRRISSRERREDIDDHDKDRTRDRVREENYERDRHREKEKERDKYHERDRVTEKEHHDHGRERKEKDRERDKAKEKEREKHKDRERVKDKEKDKDWDKAKDREREKEKEDGYKEKSKLGGTNASSMELKKSEASSDQQQSTSELEDRILKMREERLKQKKDGASEVLSWVNKSRKLEGKKMMSEKEKALHLSKAFEEQDNIVQGDNGDGENIQQATKDLAGVKILHGLDKVIEGGAVVLTLKDQNILAGGDINDDMDVLENVEIGEQKQRDAAYKAAKKTGIYEDKFNEEAGSQKKMLPQYDDLNEDEGVTLDESGRFTGVAEKKLEELRNRLQGASTSTKFDDLGSSIKKITDYYTEEEMLQFRKPKKKKSLRKKEKLDLDALEAEAISTGLGVGDLGSRNDGRRQAAKEERDRSEAQTRSDAYNAAYAKAEEASRVLRQELSSVSRVEEDENPVFGDDDEILYKSLEKARKLALKKQDGETETGPQAIASLAASTLNQSNDTQPPTSGDNQENRVVFTEMEEFVWGLQLHEETQKPESEDVFMDEDEDIKPSDEGKKDEPGGWTEVMDKSKDEAPINAVKEEVVPDETIHEAPVGKGLSGALQLLKERGTLKETIEWGGRNMDKKKSKLVGIYESDGSREIHIERTDEFGRIMTPKEAFRMISHKFHGKGPGKMKQEKRMKQYQEELKLKQMKNSDTPSLSVERMREAQARLQTPYLMLSGHVKSGENDDRRSGFAPGEDLPGGLTPMLGDRKVEHFLGIKRKSEPGSMGPPKKQKT